MAPDFRRQRSGDRDDTSRPVLITGARQSYHDELAARKKRYFLLMSVRIPALFLAAGSLALWHNPWIALAIVAGSIPIPWIAVIGANDRPPLPKGQARTYSAGRLSSNTPYSLPPSLTGTDGPSARAGGPGTGELRLGPDETTRASRAHDSAPTDFTTPTDPTPSTNESDPDQ
ncbi:DUF3099 domain-containing protein [Dietzia sp. ANT_WB102]|uniref:DUF3099 domain-containing protein n=1 Tax=Dietzia sp. ANT_WB102 TaxID=2597345 RepID=UPI0011EF59BD|nr:DUF3099 domain-containing protein [Dietzia sp. ANT_WB102]KAA0919778.1 DUF3099 domain-containing protein [Dietzia sp. ANT_WB102]